VEEKEDMAIAITLGGALSITGKENHQPSIITIIQLAIILIPSITSTAYLFQPT
jgi:hypothetical protein